MDVLNVDSDTLTVCRDVMNVSLIDSTSMELVLLNALLRLNAMPNQTSVL